MSALAYLGLKRADIEDLPVRDWRAYLDALVTREREDGNA